MNSQKINSDFSLEGTFEETIPFLDQYLSRHMPSERINFFTHYEISPGEAIQIPRSFKIQTNFLQMFKNNYETGLLRKFQDPRIDENYQQLIKILTLPMNELEILLERFYMEEVLSLAGGEVELQEALKYDELFRLSAIKMFTDHRISNATACRYNKYFHGNSIVDFVLSDIGPERVNEFPPPFQSAAIKFFFNLGISPDELKRKDHFEEEWFMLRVKILPRDLKDHSFIACGSQGILVRNVTKGLALKVSKEANYEYQILSSLSKKQAPNVVQIGEELQTFEYEKSNDFFKLAHSEGTEQIYAFSVDYIPGMSLEEKIKIDGTLKPTVVRSYGNDVLLGLLQLRRVGIYRHRDIRPANLMIDEENNRAVIIDFGIATRDKYGPQRGNTRFGGPNDLVSLGQVMYFMSTQKHLFTESDSMHVTRIKQNLKDERDFVYADPTGERLKPYLEKVTQDVIGLADVIHACLQAKGTDEDYQKLGGMFNA